MVTKQKLMFIGPDNVSRLILKIHQDKPAFQKELEISVAYNNEEYLKVISLIQGLIEKVSGERRYVWEADECILIADEVKTVHVQIIKHLLSKYPKSAKELLLNLLDTHEEVLKNFEDEKGILKTTYINVLNDLSKPYKCAKTDSLNDMVEEIHDRFLKKNNYGVYNDIIKSFKDVMTDEEYATLSKKFEESLDENNVQTIRSALEQIAACQHSVSGYIHACTFTGTLSVNERLKIAEMYIAHKCFCKAIKWLDSDELIRCEALSKERMTLKIQALEQGGKLQEAQAERQKLFALTLDFAAYDDVLKHSEASGVAAWKQSAIQTAFDFPNAFKALTFLREIKELHYAGHLVCRKYEELRQVADTALRPIADDLYDFHPLGATLLHRKMFESRIAINNPRKYLRAALDLITCDLLAPKIDDWEIHKNNVTYKRDYKGEEYMQLWITYRKTIAYLQAKKDKHEE